MAEVDIEPGDIVRVERADGIRDGEYPAAHERGRTVRLFTPFGDYHAEPLCGDIVSMTFKAVVVGGRLREVVPLTEEQYDVMCDAQSAAARQ